MQISVALIATEVADTKSIKSKFVRRKLTLPGRQLSPSVALLSHQNDRLHLNKDALKLLETINKPVAVLAICGPYRTGKSYFLSQILGIPNAFKMGHTLDPCTYGIWMGTTVLECDEFTLLLLDTEGTDNFEESNSIVSLLTVTSLLSSYLIYNSSGAPRKSDLNKMK